jgi:hypothetical protein
MLPDIIDLAGYIGFHFVPVRLFHKADTFFQALGPVLVNSQVYVKMLFMQGPAIPAADEQGFFQHPVLVGKGPASCMQAVLKEKKDTEQYG